MEGSTSHVHGPLRPIPLHCPGGGPSQHVRPAWLPCALPSALPFVGLGLRLPPNPPCHQTAIAIDDALNNGLRRFPSEKAATPFSHTPCSERAATPFHTPSTKGGLLCAPSEKEGIFGAPSEKGSIFCNSPEKRSIFCNSPEKGTILCNSPEKGTPCHTTCEKGLLPFYAASNNRTTTSDIAFIAAADNRTPLLYRACQKGSLHSASSEKANSFPVVTSSKTTTISFPSDTTTPFLLPASATKPPPPVPLHPVSDKMTTFLHNSANNLTGVIGPFPSLPHPLDLLQQLRRHHSRMTSDRLDSDVILSKTSALLPVKSPAIQITPVTPGTALQNLLSSCSTHHHYGGQHGEHSSMMTAAAAAAMVGPVATAASSSSAAVMGGFPLLSLWMSESGQHHQPHPYPYHSHHHDSHHHQPTTTTAAALTAAPGTSPYGRKVFPCPQCRYTTDRRNNLKRHMLTMHQLSAKLLECCGLLFRTKAALREHAFVFHYHGYACAYCARRFCRKALLKRHLSVHSGRKEFLCGVCDYATSHKSNLERHRRVHVRHDEVADDELLSASARPRPGGRGGGGDGGGSGGRGGEEGTSGSSRYRDSRGDASVCDDVKSDFRESQALYCHVDCVSSDDLSMLSSDDEEEEINVHGD